MTKWGMPGVYTHAFMDGWSPGYLGSVAYNHNGMMRMYETQSGSDIRPGAAARCGRRPAVGAAARGAVARAAPARRAAGGRGRGAAAAAAGAAARRPAPPTGRGGGQPREWYRGIPVPPGAARTSRAATTRTTCRPACCRGLQLTSMFPNLVVENFYRKTRNSIEAGKTEAPYGYVIPVQRDMTRVARARQPAARRSASRSARATAEIKIGDGTFPAGSYVIKRDQPYGRLAKNLLEKQDYPDPNLRTYDDSGWTMGLAMLTWT